MPIYTITNLTNYVMPVHSYIGSIAARASFVAELTVEQSEDIEARLVAMTNAGLISWTAALTSSPNSSAGKSSFGPLSIKGGLTYAGAGCPNGSQAAPAGATYLNTSTGGTAAVGAGSLTTVAAALLNPSPSPIVDYFTINDGDTLHTFQFTDATHALVMTNAHPVLVTGADANGVRDAIVTAVNATDIRVTASSGGAATVTLTQDDLGIISDAVIAEYVADAGFTRVNFAGGVNSTLWVHVTTSAIASSTNATPIAVTTLTAHGLETGSTVTIAGHVTNTAANGSWFVTYKTPTVFTLDSSVGIGVGGATGTLTYTGTGTRYGWIGK